MCSNETLVDQLECYVDDLVECFEDFVKKSLIVITIAVGAVIGLLVYVLKMVTERQEALSHASKFLLHHMWHRFRGTVERVPLPFDI